MVYIMLVVNHKSMSDLAYGVTPAIFVVLKTLITEYFLENQYLGQ